MADMGMAVQDLLRRALRGGDKRPGPPVAGEARRKADVFQIGDAGDKARILLTPDPAVDMDHHRATGIRQMPRHLRGTEQRGVAHHDEADTHAQFPFDISPRISSWRQLTYFSDQRVQRFRSSSSALA